MGKTEMFVIKDSLTFIVGSVLKKKLREPYMWYSYYTTYLLHYNLLKIALSSSKKYCFNKNDIMTNSLQLKAIVKSPWLITGLKACYNSHLGMLKLDKILFDLSALCSFYVSLIENLKLF